MRPLRRKPKPVGYSRHVTNVLFLGREYSAFCNSCGWEQLCSGYAEAISLRVAHEDATQTTFYDDGSERVGA